MKNLEIKSNKNLKPGDVVTIYENFGTELSPEGNAKLLTKITPHDHGIVNGCPVEWWVVKFLSDGFKCQRFIVNHNLLND